MNSIISTSSRKRENFIKWDLIVFIVLTVLAILNGQTTVFYIIYLFWWYEIIRIIIGLFFRVKNKDSIIQSPLNSFWGGLFLMGIYWVFIVVIFGFIASLDDDEALIINFQVLGFRNWFFNLNLIFIIGERLFLHTRKNIKDIQFGPFNSNTITIHISIILGAILLFFVVKKFPDIFTPENRWGSALIILPFLFIKTVIQHYFKELIEPIEPQYIKINDYEKD